MNRVIALGVSELGLGLRAGVASVRKRIRKGRVRCSGPEETLQN